jgi:hypothetical protein
MTMPDCAANGGTSIIAASSNTKARLKVMGMSEMDTALPEKNALATKVNPPNLRQAAAAFLDFRCPELFGYY